MSQPNNLYYASALLLIEQAIKERVFPTAIDHFAVAAELAKLTEEHDERVRVGRTTYRQDLLWLALARAAGLKHDHRGCITGGPKLPGVQP